MSTTGVSRYKLIIDFLLNRKNSINGRRYGDDPTILAWETGERLASSASSLIFVVAPKPRLLVR